jgi:alkylated DNA repair protein (DNA oxidative demethylase)
MHRPLPLPLFPTRLGPAVESLAPGAVLLRGLVEATTPELLAELRAVLAAAPLRQLSTPGGKPMSVATTSCGSLGWHSDRRGYRYSPIDPQSGHPWPPLPATFLRLASVAAERAGYPDFVPDSGLVNRYQPGARMSLHQDRDERDFAQPIVSLSLGIAATFLLGGAARSDRPQRIRLEHGDVVVFGGPARLRFHGVLPVAAADHPELGEQRVNLTLRRAD